MTPEGRVKAKVKAYLKERGIWFTMPAGTGFGASGVPDFLCCAAGRLVAVETKAPGKRNNTTTMQKAQIAAINAAGGTAVVIDDVSQLEGVL
jgi:pantoate kinase